MRTLLTVSLLALSTSGSVYAEDRFFSYEDVFNVERAANPAISPDGSWVAYQRLKGDMNTDTYRSSIWLVDLDNDTDRPLIQGSGSYSSPVWSPSGDRLAFTASEDGASSIRVWYADTRETAIVAELPRGASGLTWSTDGEALAFGSFVPATGEAGAVPPAKTLAKPSGAEWAAAAIVIDDVIYRTDSGGWSTRGATQLFVLDAAGGTPRQITDEPQGVGGSFSWTSDKQILISSNLDEDADLQPGQSAVYRVDVASGAIEKLTDRDGPEFGPRITPNENHIVYTGYDDERMGYHNAVITVQRLDSGEKLVLGAGLDRSIGLFRFSTDEDLIWFTYDDIGVTKLAHVDEDDTITVVAENLGGGAFGRPYPGGSFDVGPNGMYAATISTPTEPSELVIATDEGEELYRTDLNSDVLGHKDIPDAEYVRTTSVDGLEVDGWLIRPAGWERGDEPAPMILEIHGGPFANYGPRFTAECQLMASAGYAVLYTNPRGSTSYGYDFANEIHHNYPSKDYDDLIALTDAAVAMGGIDEDRLFVTGGSGGGVLTAWIVGKTDMFAAAVSAKPVINWISCALTSDAYPFFMRYWFPGLPWEIPEQYWERSPLSLVGNVTTPTMLLTGEDDWRTPMSETEQYYQALKLREVPTRMVRFPGSSHSIASRPSRLCAKVAEILRWFEMHDPANAE